MINIANNKQGQIQKFGNGGRGGGGTGLVDRLNGTKYSRMDLVEFVEDSL